MKDYEEIRAELKKELEQTTAEGFELGSLLARYKDKFVEAALYKFDKATLRQMEIGSHVSEAIRLSLEDTGK